MMRLNTTIVWQGQNSNTGNRMEYHVVILFIEMSSVRARFKYALRQCRLDELTISSAKLAD